MFWFAVACERLTHNPLVPGSSPGGPTSTNNGLQRNLQAVLFCGFAESCKYYVSKYGLSPSFGLGLRVCLVIKSFF